MRAFKRLIAVHSCGSQEYHDGQPHQHQRQGGRSRSIDIAGVLDVYGPSKGLESQERDGPEIADGVKRHQEAAGGDGGPQLWNGDAEEGLPGALPQGAGCILQCTA